MHLQSGGSVPLCPEMGRDVRPMQPSVIANPQVKQLVHYHVLLEAPGFFEQQRREADPPGG